MDEDTSRSSNSNNRQELNDSASSSDIENTSSSSNTNNRHEVNDSTSSTDNDEDNANDTTLDTIEMGNSPTMMRILRNRVSVSGEQTIENADDDYDETILNFDKVLPSEHTYLGDDMEERRGRTFWEDNSYHNIMLLPPPTIVLVPGQILPLSVVDVYTIKMLEYCIDRDGIFGVMVKWPSKYGKLHDPDYVGTTAEIYEYHKKLDESGETRLLTIKAKARQRFKFLELVKEGEAHFYQAKVRILPEVVLQDVFYDISPNLNRHQSSNLNLFRKRDAMMTGWPLWVYDQYYTPKLVARVENELEYLKRGRNFELPKNPTTLSFWVAQNLPPKQRLNVLKINSAIQRLRWELSLLEACQIFMCVHCLAKVGHQSDIIAMSVDGPQGTYVNPEGYLHETVTLSRARHLTVLGIASTEYSWFPGYAWIPAYCKNCRNHMGWKFTAQRSNLKPERFWGLSRRSLKVKIDTDSEEDSHVM